MHRRSRTKTTRPRINRRVQTIQNKQRNKQKMYTDTNRKPKERPGTQKNCARCFNSTRELETLQLICNKGVDIVNTWTTAQWCDYYRDVKAKNEQLKLFNETIDREITTNLKNTKKHTTKWTSKK